MAKVYVGCALTGAPKEFVDAVEIFKCRLREAGHEVADFVGVVNGTAFDVYETDIHKCVAECEFMIAICDLPSIGLGWELAVAVEKLRKPTLALAHQDTAVSRLPIGADCGRNLNYHFLRYNNVEHMLQLTQLFISSEKVRVA